MSCTWPDSKRHDLAMCPANLSHRTSGWVSRKSWFWAGRNHHPPTGLARPLVRALFEAWPVCRFRSASLRQCGALLCQVDADGKPAKTL
jgi:hypothetical protein